MKVPSAVLLLCSLVSLLFHCRSTPDQNQDSKEQKPPLTAEEFSLLDWQRQVEYLEPMAYAARSISGEEARILATALNDDDSAVIIKALELVHTLGLKEYLPQAAELLNSSDPMIRWRALLVIEKLNGNDELLPQVAKLTGDREWLVREAAYRTLRTFNSERKNRTFFYTVLLRLNEKNPAVVAEIYRTLVWYDDESAWPYMIKRSYHCKSVSELILVMRELARTKTREVQIRLKTLARSQSALVRQEAAALLREYF